MSTTDKNLAEEALTALFGDDGDEEAPVQVPRERPRLLMMVDASSSMQWLRGVTVMAVDAFNATLAHEVPHCKATLGVFSDTVDPPWYNDVPLPTVRSIDESYHPYGGTALYDAIVSTVKLAEKNYPDDSVVLAFQTDGEDMNSRSTINDATGAIRRARARGWQVVFIGASDNVTGQATLGMIGSHMGVDPNLVLTYNPSSSSKAFEGMAENIATWMKGYADAGFTDAQRRLAGEIRKHTRTLGHETKKLTDQSSQNRRLLESK